MMRRKLRVALLVCALLTATSAAALPQVVPANRIADPEIRDLQEKYARELASLAEDLQAERFPYHFYFSRKLDIDERRQRHTDQRSIQFSRFEGHVVLQITGNYYAAYDRDLLKPEQRAGQTFHDVLLPMLRAAVQRFHDTPEVEGYALEISHHVIGRVWGITMENPENLVVILTKSAASQLVEAKDASQQQAALAQGQVLLNARPVAANLAGIISVHK